MAIGVVIFISLLLTVVFSLTYYGRQRKAINEAHNQDVEDPPYEDINHVPLQCSLGDISARVKVEPNPSYNLLKERKQANEPVYAEIEDPMRVKLNEAYELHGLNFHNMQTPDFANRDAHESDRNSIISE